MRVKLKEGKWNLLDARERFEKLAGRQPVKDILRGH